MLSFDCQLDGLILRKAIAVPEPLDEIETKIASQRLLDQLAVAFPGAGCADLHGPKDLLVDRQSSTDLGHRPHRSIMVP